MIRIPPKNRDLRRYVFKKRLQRVILLVLWLALWLSGAMLYNQSHQTYPDSRRMTGWRLAILMLVMLVIGFFLFRIWKLFTERPVSGTVIRAGIAHTYTPGDDSGSAIATDYDFRLKTALLIQTSDGKRRCIRFEQKTGTYLYYREGESLVRLGGLPYPINTDPASPHGYVCAACGRHHKDWCDVCELCGMSLIDPKEL